MMRVFALHRKMDRRSHGRGQRAEEMRRHLAAHCANGGRWELAGENGHGNLGTTIVEGRVEDAVKEAVKEAVRSAVETVVEENGAPTNN